MAIARRLLARIAAWLADVDAGAEGYLACLDRGLGLSPPRQADVDVPARKRLLALAAAGIIPTE